MLIHSAGLVPHWTVVQADCWESDLIDTINKKASREDLAFRIGKVQNLNVTGAVVGNLYLVVHSSTVLDASERKSQQSVWSSALCNCAWQRAERIVPS